MQKEIEKEIETIRAKKESAIIAQDFEKPQRCEMPKNRPKISWSES